jgi:hypothetical protein
MKVIIKLTGLLYGEILRDIARPHPFAGERVGFVSGREGALQDDGKLILLNRYHSIPDDHYIDDPTVGARIGSEAMASAMNAVYRGQACREGVYHIHVHAMNGETGMSRTDRIEIPRLIPGLQSVSGAATHGIIILSLNHGSGWAWLPGSREPVCADSINIIGAPVGVFDRRTVV